MVATRGVGGNGSRSRTVKPPEPYVDIYRRAQTQMQGGPANIPATTDTYAPSGGDTWALLAADRERRAAQPMDLGALDGWGSYGGGGGGGGGRRYGGGGGGGGSSLAAQGQTQIDMLMNLLNSGALRSPERTFTPDEALRQRLAQAVSADRAASTGAYDSLDQFLAAMPQAFADTRATAQDVDNADLRAFLASQGGTDAGLQAEARFLQSQAQADADARNRYIDALRGSETQAAQSRQTEAKLGREDALRQLTAAERGLTAQLDQRDEARRRQIEDQNFQQRLADRQAAMQLIAQLAQIAGSTGATVPNIDIAALLGGLS